MVTGDWTETRSAGALVRRVVMRAHRDHQPLDSRPQHSQGHCEGPEWTRGWTQVSGGFSKRKRRRERGRGGESAHREVSVMVGSGPEAGKQGRTGGGGRRGGPWQAAE